MSDDRKRRAEAARRERNQRLVKLIEDGEDIPPLYDPELMHFPSRPAIAKDQRAIDKIFGLVSEGEKPDE